MRLNQETRTVVAMTAATVGMFAVCMIQAQDREPWIPHPILCIDGERLYDSTRDKGCAGEGYAVNRSADALQPLFTERGTEEKLREELEVALEAIPEPNEKPTRMEVVVLPPPEEEGDFIDDFVEDPVDGVWDGFVWILERIASALAISP